MAGKVANVYIQNNIYPVEQIFDKSLYFTTKVNIRSAPSINGRLIKTSAPGDEVGKVYSYVVDDDNKLWWMLNDNTFVQHNRYWYDTRALAQQGVKTTQQVEKEKKEEQKSQTASMWDDVKGLFSTNNLLKVGGVILGITLIKSLLTNKR
jgi:hypothetical protein